MPVWISDNKIDPSWINDNIHSIDGHVSECVVKDVSNDTRKGDVGEMEQRLYCNSLVNIMMVKKIL